MVNNNYNLSEIRKTISKLEPTIKDYSLERQKLRLEIAKKMVNQGSYNSKTKEFNNPVEYDKRIDFIIGIAGGGKSTALANPLSKQNKALIIDSDWAKEQLPEYDDGLGATRVHLESKLIFMLALENALRNNMNIVISIVGKTLQTIIDIYELAKENGYEQHLHLNEVAPHIACDRAMERFEETGRYIDPNYILNEIGYKPSENYKKLKVMNIFNSYEKYNNNVPFGEKPILIERIIKEEQMKLDMEDEWALEP
ncbi:zeta toxin family protein [Tissierella carlieri]|uniref:zeta toxin family protein n=1 Tax=Tissierella TaxID=41273 RepID=UPI003040E1C8